MPWLPNPLRRACAVNIVCERPHIYFLGNVDVIMELLEISLPHQLGQRGGSIPKQLSQRRLEDRAHTDA